MAARSATARFSSELEQAPGKKATGIVIPPAILDQLGAGKKPPIPTDLDDAFAPNPGAKTFFDTLSNSLQRYHVDNINGAKAADTRQRRVDTSIALFLEGKQR